MLEPFALATRLLGWDGKWLFIEQRFEKQGVVHAAAVVKAVMRQRGRSIPFGDLARACGHLQPSPPLPDLERWEAVLASKVAKEAAP
jgi:carbonic anhydrase/acetyltransferase-like protein (isoleucine patch superfamily)